MRNQHIALPDLASALAIEGVQASYHALYKMIVNGEMPTATRLPSGRWIVEVSALPEIAEAYIERHPSAAAA
jgi:hypothetical protein